MALCYIPVHSPRISWTLNTSMNPERLERSHMMFTTYADKKKTCWYDLMSSTVLLTYLDNQFAEKSELQKIYLMAYKHFTSAEAGKRFCSFMQSGHLKIYSFSIFQHKNLLYILPASQQLMISKCIFRHRLDIWSKNILNNCKFVVCKCLQSNSQKKHWCMITIKLGKLVNNHRFF